MYLDLKKILSLTLIKKIYFLQQKKEILTSVQLIFVN